MTKVNLVGVRVFLSVLVLSLGVILRVHTRCDGNRFFHG